MSDKAKPSGRRTTRLLLLLAFTFTLFLPAQRPAGAQQTACPGNLVTNGDFTGGAVAGPMGAGGAVGGWSGYGTPDVSTTQGANDPNAVGMWGNMNPTMGEGLSQTLALVPGKTYVGSVWFRRAADPTKQPYATFRVRANAGAAPQQWGLPGTVYVSPSITSTAWAAYSFTFQAPAAATVLTFNVENYLSTLNGGDTSYGLFDNVCIREAPPDFKSTAACQGQATSFGGPSNGVTSWNWDFGDGTPNSTQQSPTHTYAAAGTYNVTLCVNGTTNCVTKPVTVNAAPPAPVINGPADACGLPNATYSVQPAAGLSYSWAVSNGTVNGPSTSSSVNITPGPGPFAVTVTATNKAGCSTSTRMVVKDCDLHPGDCCKDFLSKASLNNFTHQGNGLYSFDSVLSINQPNITRVTAHVISASLSYVPTACGQAAPVSAYVSGATPAPAGFTSAVPVPFGDEALWYNSAGATVGGLSFPFQIKFPPPPAPGTCKEYVSFCVKYTYTDRNCRACEAVRCFGPFLRNPGGKHSEETK